MKFKWAKKKLLTASLNQHIIDHYEIVFDLLICIV
jgi:hypothetical protein